MNKKYPSIRMKIPEPEIVEKWGISQVVHEKITDTYGWVCETCEKPNISKSTAYRHKKKGHKVNYRLIERTFERETVKFPKNDGES